MLYFSKLKKTSPLVKWLIVFLALEIFSYLVWYWPQVGWIFLLIVALATISLLYSRPVFALYIPLAEIFWGSLGHSMEYRFISLRLLIFVLVLTFFSLQNINKFKELKILADKKLFYIYLGLLAIIFFDILWGALRQPNFNKVFYDANAYLYVLYLPIWYQLYDRKYLKQIFGILKAAALIVAVKTLLLLNVFSQNYSFLDLSHVYKWVRDTRTGEITSFKDSFFRIFMQSQFYLVVAWFFLWLGKIRAGLDKKTFLFLSLISAALYVSLSRSFWLGIFIALVFIIINIFIYQQKKISFKIFVNLFFLAIASILMVEIFYNLPDYKNINVFTQRTVDSSESALSSRSQLWTPMWSTIATSPVIGHGFGKEITYQSFDPRIRNEFNPDGWHTTYAFEWGWMDQLVKGGILHLAVFIAWVVLLYQRLYSSWSKEQVLSGVFMSILTALLIIHIFTPYINHPLGLSVLMLISIIFGPYDTEIESYN